MLSNGLHRGLIVSTLSELRGVLPLAEEGILDEVYPTPSPIPISNPQSNPTTKIKQRPSTASQSTPPPYPISTPCANPTRISTSSY